MFRCKADDADQALGVARKILETTRDICAPIIPIPCIGLAFVAFIALIDKIEETRSNQQGLKAVLNEVTALVNMVETAMLKVKVDIEVIPSNDPRHDTLVKDLQGSSEFKTCLEDFSKDLEALQGKAESKLYHRPWYLRWFRSSRDAAALEELRKGIVNCRNGFQFQSQVVIQTSVRDVLKKLSDLEDNDTLESLPRAEASYRAEAITMKSNFLPGTRIELLQAIDDWVEQSQTFSGKAVCILTGDAGTGKSTIACEFARIRDQKKDYGASFFFVRGKADFDSTRLVFPTLAYQLARSQGALYPHIVKAAREHLIKGKNQQMKYEAPNLIHGPVYKVHDEHPLIVLVVDALDECSESKEMRDLAPEMLNWLMKSVHEARFPLRIFFTARPNSFIENTLQRSQWASLIHKISLHDLPPESIQRDMAIFVRHKLDKLPSGQELLRKRPDVAERLAERAGDLFVYVETVVDFLHDYPDFVEDGLDKLLSEGSSEFATTLQPLDDLYLTVLEIALPTKVLSQVKRLRHALTSTLGNIAVLRNPMSPAVLESLTSVPRKETSNILTRLRSVFADADNSKPDDEKLFHPMHGTFTQFLLDARRCMSPLYHVDASRQHARLAAGCLRVLLTLKENMCQLQDTAVPKAEIPDLAKRLEKYVPEHVQYACAQWAAHLGDACGLGKEHSGGTQCECREIGERLAVFARRKLAPWVEMMSYMGRLDVVKGALDTARTYLKDSPQYEDVDSLLEGSRQLVVDHYSKIEKYPYNGVFVDAKIGPVQDGADEPPLKESSGLAPTQQPLDDSQYITALEIAFPSKDLSQNLQLRRVLQWTLGNIAVLRNPMSPVDLEALTGEPRKDVCDVLSRLRLVMLCDADKPYEKFRSMDATFPQFLLDANRCRSPSYHVNASHQHSRLAVGCLRALLVLKENMCQLPDAAVPKAEISDWAERLGKYIPEHVQYACAYWAVHLGDACVMKKKTESPRKGRDVCACWEIGGALEALTATRTKLRAWVEVMAYMGKLDAVAQALHIAQVHLQDASEYQKVNSLLAETKTLVAAHYSEIDLCPYVVHQVKVPS